MSTDNQFITWKKELDEKFLRYNVSLYQLKYVYEKKLKNPSLFPNQDCLKPCDYLFIDRYVYISNEFRSETLEDTLENDYKGDIDLVSSNIISNINTHNNVRVGFFTRRNDDKPTYFILSTHNEDEKYYTKCDEYMYDHLEYMIYYMVRYNIDYNAAYMLSGMTKMDKNYMEKYGLSEFPTCPYGDDSLNKEDSLRFYKEYFELVNLSNVFSEFSEIVKGKYDYKEVERICEKYNFPINVYYYFKTLNNIC